MHYEQKLIPRCGGIIALFACCEVSNICYIMSLSSKIENGKLNSSTELLFHCTTKYWSFAMYNIATCVFVYIELHSFPLLDMNQLLHGTESDTFV